MPKEFYCAECGLEILVYRKALQAQQRIVDLVAPHTCSEDDPKIPFNVESLPAIVKKKSKVDEIFDSFKFVKKLNGLSKPLKKGSYEVEKVEESGDKRPKEDRRETSTAPEGLLGMLKNMPASEPENE